VFSTIIDTFGRFDKHFSRITCDTCKISCAVIAPMQCFQNALAYFAVAVTYAHKMPIKLVPVHLIDDESSNGCKLARFAHICYFFAKKKTF
jgi:hypothetical protein